MMGPAKAVKISGALLLFVLLAGRSALAVECGDTITSRAGLDRDLICTTNPALTINGGSLDLNGFTIVCDQSITEVVGVALEGRGARLSDGAITGCFVSVRVGGSGGHIVRDVTASASNQGVLIATGSDGNRLLNSHILRGLDDAAIQVDGSNNFLLLNDVAGSTDQGFEINGSGNRIVGNRIGGVAEGVQLGGEGNGNIVLRNQIIGATERGVEVRAGAHVIKDNLIADGAADGIALLDQGNGNEVSGNVIYGHRDQGLFVGTTSNTIERSQVLRNKVDLTDANPGCDENLWRDNVFETSVSDDCVH
jgi:hypothetical protein